MDVHSFARLAAVLAIAVHSLQRDYLRAVMWSAISAALMLQLVFYEQRGYVGKFVLLEVLTSAGLAGLEALLIGIPFHAFREWGRRSTGGNLVARPDGTEAERGGGGSGVARKAERDDENASDEGSV